MKRSIATLLLCSLSCAAFAQAQLVISDDAFIILRDSAKLVLGNPSANALQTLGSGGNIVSEGEKNAVKWNTGANTGNYVVPFTTKPAAQGGDGVKIPLTIDVSSPGSSDGALLLSTYRTNNANQPYPSMVSNMYSAAAGSDASGFAIDRFWVLNADAFTTKPSATVSMVYDDGALETGGSNSFTEGSLKAQRWDPAAANDHWGGIQLGSVNTATNTISGITVTPTSFFTAWTLVSTAAPLPVKLLSFAGDCYGGNLAFDWATGSEADNNFFDLQQSPDGSTWTTIASMFSQGNGSAAPQRYHWDANGSPRAFYRLAMTDFTGRQSFGPVITAGCDAAAQGSILVLNHDGRAAVLFQGSPGSYDLALYDVSGQQVGRRSIVAPAGTSRYELETGALAAGIYLVRISGHEQIVQQKVSLDNR